MKLLPLCVASKKFIPHYYPLYYFQFSLSHNLIVLYHYVVRFILKIFLSLITKTLIYSYLSSEIRTGTSFTVDCVLEIRNDFDEPYRLCLLLIVMETA